MPTMFLGTVLTAGGFMGEQSTHSKTSDPVVLPSHRI